MLDGAIERASKLKMAQNDLAQLTRPTVTAADPFR
jgi:hypothetical protein